MLRILDVSRGGYLEVFRESLDESIGLSGSVWNKFEKGGGLVSRNRQDRGALIALALALSAILAVAFITNAGDGQSVAGSDLAREHYGPAEGHRWPEFSARDTYAQWTMAAFSVLATFVSVWAIWLLYKTLAFTRSAVGAALEANRLIAADQRPWLEVEVTNIVLDLRDGLAFVKITYVLKNLGRTPAMEIECNARVFDMMKSALSKESVHRFYESVVSRGSIMGSVMLPGSEVEESHITHTSTNDKSYHEIEDIKHLNVSVAVAYRFQGGGGITGKTFIVRLTGTHSDDVGYPIKAEAAGTLYSQVV